MSYIARIKNWITGEVLTAADLNNEIDNCIDRQIPEPSGIAQGDILFRDASVWAKLAAGTDGQVLKTGGASANPSWVTRGFADRGDASSVDFALGALTTDGTWRDLDFSSVVPAGATAISLFVEMDDDAAGSFLLFRENGNSNSINVCGGNTQVANIPLYLNLIVSCDTGRVIEYKAENLTWTTINITVTGWWF